MGEEDIISSRDDGDGGDVVVRTGASEPDHDDGEAQRSSVYFSPNQPRPPAGWRAGGLNNTRTSPPRAR